MDYLRMLVNGESLPELGQQEQMQKHQEEIRELRNMQVELVNQKKEMGFNYL